MLLRLDWEFDSVTQVLGWQYFSLLLYLFVWFYATFWLCSGRLEFGYPRDIIFPLTAFFLLGVIVYFTQESIQDCDLGGVYFPIFNFLYFYITFLQWFLVTGFEEHLSELILAFPYPSENSCQACTFVCPCIPGANNSSVFPTYSCWYELMCFSDTKYQLKCMNWRWYLKCQMTL